MFNLTKNLFLRGLTIFLFMAFLATGYYLLRPDSSPDLVRKEDRDLSGDVLRPDLEKKRSGLEPVALPLPQYQGAPIGVINEDKSVVSIYPEETKQKLKNELLAFETSLRATSGSEAISSNLDGWLRVGVIKKFFGDYLGARDAWEYASLIRPQNSTSFANLGGLYGLYLKDFPKAEFNYKKAIENSPGDIYLYTSLADLYLNTSPDLVSKDRDLSGERPDLEGGRSGLESAVAIIQSGLTANPDNITLLSYLARFYKEQGNFPKALEYYQKVLVLDPSNQAVKAEIEALKKR